MMHYSSLDRNKFLFLLTVSAIFRENRDQPIPPRFSSFIYSRTEPFKTSNTDFYGMAPNEHCQCSDGNS